jgi:hypothetical protein
MAEGITEQAAHQMWGRIVRKNPDLANIHKRRRRNESQRLLEKRMGKSPRKTA